MRIAKPLMLVSTPVGVVWGLAEAWRLAGGLVFLMLAMVSLIAVAFASVVATIRRERRAATAAPAPPGVQGG
jgi:hypothetical protein